MPIDAFGGKLLLRRGSHSVSAVFYNGLPDFDDMLFLERVLRPGDSFLDVGANEGVYTVLAASVLGRDGRIVAIEPDGPTRARLSEHVALNGLRGVSVHGVAVGERRGWVRLTLDQGTMNHVLEARDEVGEGEVDEGWCACRTLDEICASDPPTFAKMDIEGLEAAALRGARELLRRRRPAAWIVEINQCAERYGSGFDDVAAIVHAAGGELCTYDATSRLLTSVRSMGELKWGNAILVLDRPFVQTRLAGL